MTDLVLHEACAHCLQGNQIQEYRNNNYYYSTLQFAGFKSCDVVVKSRFILETELWGSHYEELLHIVKSYIIDIWELRKSNLYGSGTGPLQHRSRPGRDNVCQGKGKFGKLGGGSHAVLFMVPLRPPGARPMAEALRLPFEHLLLQIRKMPPSNPR